MKKGLTELSGLNFTRQQSCAMDNRRYIDLIFFDAVNNPIRLFDQFPANIAVIFGHFAARQRICSDLHRSVGDFIHHLFGIGGRVQGNIFVDVDQMRDSVVSPLNFQEVNPNRLRTSLTSVVRP